ncbi:TetR/AcrR family transcriptional regulator [Glycomyces buryatensis]|uniref:TetR family transcriptional regulator n=1 Tax=Glycomyces buryatensis TaxID=2570927 RepID=A0A4S8Q397_9ACTN|nr:TetR family transcriptional regulator [Glycomyces buryatensis]THV36995.1 TetR family transcriptional regulator [Glycomyces buryatensis]
MEHRNGLRERKKNATWELLRNTAIDLFEERGYDNVSVAQVAAAAEVSKATVFNYFPAKEDLVIGGMKHHVGDDARVVRERAKGQTPHAALREHFLRLLEAGAPQTGLSGNPMYLRIQQLLMSSPTLLMTTMGYRRHSSVLLSEVLIEEGHEDLTARLVASQLMHTKNILAEVNVHHILEGRTVEELRPGAITAAEHAFGLLEHGIGDLMRRETEPQPTDVAFGPEGCRVEYAVDDPETREPSALREATDEMLRSLASPDGPLREARDKMLKSITERGKD